MTQQNKKVHKEGEGLVAYIASTRANIEVELRPGSDDRIFLSVTMVTMSN